MARVIFGGSVSAGTAPNEITLLRTTLRRGLMAALAIGVVLQIILMVGALFVGVLADAVVPGRNTATLWGLLLLGITLYGVAGLLDTLRARLLFDVAGAIDQRLTPHVHDGITHVERSGSASAVGLEPLYDADRLRSFLTGPVPAALIDLCAAPVALILLFSLHVWLGFVAMLAFVAVGLIAWLTGRSAAKRATWLAETAPWRMRLAEEIRRNAGLSRSMGMESPFRQRWIGMSQDDLMTARALHRRSIGLAGTMRGLRLVLFALLLGIGTALAFSDRATWSTAIVAAVLLYQVLAPLDQAMGGLGELSVARGAWHRLTELIRIVPRIGVTTILPRPESELTTEQLFVVAPGTSQVVVQNIGIRLAAGDALGIMGGTGAGKTALLNAITGMWPAARGSVRFDGASLDQWSPDELSAHIGFVPQQVELIDGTIAQNIARFAPDPPTASVLEAARRAEVHEMILRLPEGYETQLGREGQRLPAGMRQRLAVARALYGNPFLLVLDDPTANMDGEGEQMLANVIENMCDGGSMVIVVTHRPILLHRVDYVMQMQGGSAVNYGARDVVLQRLREAAVPAIRADNAG
jgi:PrtD family type I secretion system ABC transporter